MELSYDEDLLDEVGPNPMIGILIRRKIGAQTQGEC